jgi:hypothetical protein
VARRLAAERRVREIGVELPKAPLVRSDEVIE